MISYMIFNLIVTYIVYKQSNEGNQQIDSEIMPTEIEEVEFMYRACNTKREPQK